MGRKKEVEGKKKEIIKKRNIKRKEIKGEIRAGKESCRQKKREERATIFKV